MKTYKKVVKISNSLGFIIDKSITDILRIKKGDYVEVEILKVKNSKEITLKDLSPELINEIKAIAIEELKIKYAEQKSL